jgi:hypothetical protein
MDAEAGVVAPFPEGGGCGNQPACLPGQVCVIDYIGPDKCGPPDDAGVCPPGTFPDLKGWAPCCEPGYLQGCHGPSIPGCPGDPTCCDGGEVTCACAGIYCASPDLCEYGSCVAASRTQIDCDCSPH